MSEDDHQSNPDAPGSYDEALAAGFEPIDDIDGFLSENGLLGEDANGQKGLRAFSGLMHDCATSPIGSPCFDFCYSNGVRILAFCGPTRQCDRFVRGDCDPAVR